MRDSDRSKICPYCLGLGYRQFNFYNSNNELVKAERYDCLACMGIGTMTQIEYDGVMVCDED